MLCVSFYKLSHKKSHFLRIDQSINSTVNAAGMSKGVSGFLVGENGAKFGLFEYHNSSLPKESRLDMADWYSHGYFIW